MKRSNFLSNLFPTFVHHRDAQLDRIFYSTEVPYQMKVPFLKRGAPDMAYSSPKVAIVGDGKPMLGEGAATSLRKSE